MTKAIPASPQPSPALRERGQDFARRLRRGSTDAERLIWSRLRDRRLGSFKFRRQHPIGPFFADCACIEAMLVVELDGGQHFEDLAIAADHQRTQYFESLGFQVLRFDNGQVVRETTAVLQVILDSAQLRCDHPHPSSLPQAGEGAKPGAFQ
jgi:very-short-patch-repair endonuclease